LDPQNGRPRHKHKRHRDLGLAALAALLLAGCATSPMPPGPDPYGIEQAAVIGGDEPTRPLTPLLAERVRLVTWNAPSGDMAPGASHVFPYPIWATVDGELRKFCQAYSAAQHPAPGELQLRLEQLLGLHPGDGTGRALITIEIDRARVMRPCPDSAVDTTACQATFDRASLAKALDRDPEATRFLLDQMLLSYKIDGYPFTRRGYTYDWSREAAAGHFGLSEYVTKAATTATIVDAPQIPADYCAAPPQP
jgi:hypothetical protein